MRRWKFRLLSLLMTLVYAWVLTASAGFVICIGSDGHLALEPTVGRHCQEPQTLQAERPPADRDGLPSLTGRTCVDVPVPAPLQHRTNGGTAKRTQHRDGSAAPDAIGLCALAPAAFAPVLDCGRPRVLATGSHPTLTLLNSVVLRL